MWIREINITFISLCELGVALPYSVCLQVQPPLHCSNSSTMLLAVRGITESDVELWPPSQTSRGPTAAVITKESNRLWTMRPALLHQIWKLSTRYLNQQIPWRPTNNNTVFHSSATIDVNIWRDANSNLLSYHSRRPFILYAYPTTVKPALGQTQASTIIQGGKHHCFIN